MLNRILTLTIIRIINFKLNTKPIMDNTSKVLLAVAAGAAAGLVAGILLAPASGEETRENLKKQGQKLKDDVSSTLEELNESAKEKIDQIKQTASHAINEKTA